MGSSGGQAHTATTRSTTSRPKDRNLSRCKCRENDQAASARKLRAKKSGRLQKQAARADRVYHAPAQRRACARIAFRWRLSQQTSDPQGSTVGARVALIWLVASGGLLAGS